MPRDENARRDSALESIARDLGKIEGHLKVIAEKGRLKFANTPPDPFKPSGEPEPVEPPEAFGPRFPHPTVAYLKRSDLRDAPEPRSGD